MKDRFAHIMSFWYRLCGSTCHFSNYIYLSEKSSSDRNWCLGNYKFIPVVFDIIENINFQVELHDRLFPVFQKGKKIIKHQ